jgi:gliding motility-associated-like protein
MYRLKPLTLILSTLFFFTLANAQTVIWSEGFQNGCASDCLASGYTGSEGPWTVMSTGTNGSDANTWYVSGAECGNAATACGTDCGATDPSLHVGSNASIFGDIGAAYLNGGAGFFDPLTDSRAESPTIDLSGQSTITLSFNYIENGDGVNDNATLWYFNGTVWSQIDALAKTALTCAPQGTWTAYSVILPASANNNANVKIGFRWVNNDDGVGTDPSFAVDDIQLTVASSGTPPVADFSTPVTTICAGTCIDFTNTSTFGVDPSFSWDFGNGSTSSSQNPTGICYNATGVYTVTLTVSDPGGTDTEAKTSFISVIDPSTAGVDNTGSVCNTTTFDVTSLLSGEDPGGVWAETTAVPSAQFNTTTGVFDANGLTPGNYTFSYTVTGTSPCPNDEANFTITVNECSGGPTAVITTSNGTVCQGQSLIFNSASTGTNIYSSVWSFGGGFPGTANTPGPHSIIFNTVGNFDILLTVTDDFGTDDTLITIQVVSCSTPTAAFSISDADPCAGDCIIFTNNSSSISTPTFSWTFNGGSPATSTSANPGPVCFNTPGTYTITLVVTNSFGTGSYSQNITVLAPPVITVSDDDFISLGDTALIYATASDGDITWSWTPNNQGDILDCTISDCSEAEVTPVITTLFTATTTTSEGCEASENVQILVIVPTGGYSLGVPNSFSPNEDGNNDILYVDGLGITSMVFRVYNRYGQMVFETTDQSIGWNGTFNQEPLNPATFAWILEYSLVSGESGKKNGNVTLLK